MDTLNGNLKRKNELGDAYSLTYKKKIRHLTDMGERKGKGGDNPDFRNAKDRAD